MVVFAVLVLNQKNLFKANLILNSKVIFTVLLLTGNVISEKFGPKKENLQFKMKFGTSSNSNVENSMVRITYVILTGETVFGQI